MLGVADRGLTTNSCAQAAQWAHSRARQTHFCAQFAQHEIARCAHPGVGMRTNERRVPAVPRRSRQMLQIAAPEIDVSPNSAHHTVRTKSNPLCAALLVSAPTRTPRAPMCAFRGFSAQDLRRFAVCIALRKIQMPFDMAGGTHNEACTENHAAFSQTGRPKIQRTFGRPNPRLTWNPEGSASPLFRRT